MALLLQRFLSKQARQTSTSSLNDPLNALGVSAFVFDHVLEQGVKVDGRFLDCLWICSLRLHAYRMARLCTLTCNLTYLRIPPAFLGALFVRVPVFIPINFGGLNLYLARPLLICALSCILSWALDVLLISAAGEETRFPVSLLSRLFLCYFPSFLHGIGEFEGVPSQFNIQQVQQKASYHYK
jgi:hypothetical protein